MVCMERFQRFMRDMQAHDVPVLLCGVRPDFASALENLRFYKWLPRDHVFLEEPAAGSSTLHAVRHAYELLGTDRCPTCPRPLEPQGDAGGWHYVI